jgi:hypothetical protein
LKKKKMKQLKKQQWKAWFKTNQNQLKN